MPLLDFSHIYPLPLHFFGYKNVPGVPLVVDQWLGTLARLAEREIEIRSAKRGLTNTYRIGANTATGYSYLYGAPGTPSAAAAARNNLSDTLKGSPMHAAAAIYAKLAPAHPDASAPAVTSSDPLTRLSLDDPAQFAMSWTTFDSVYQNALPQLPDWSTTLTDPAVAARQFWPTLACYGLPYNLLILKKLNAGDAPAFKARFGAGWTAAFDQSVAAGLLYAIDLSIFSTLQPQQADGFTRFTPATVTLLTQDAATKDLTPVAIWVAGYQGAGAQVYAPGTSSASAWLYALQAAKTSATVWGIWLGHVYHWHVVTAAMLMTMLNNVPQGSALRLLLEPQSNYVMAFDNVLFLLWEAIAPPTSITSVPQFLSLCDTFAAGRQYFDDDPLTTLQKLGLQESDFTVTTPWDKYPLVARQLSCWNATADYVNVFVDRSYASDAAVAADTGLQAWMAAAGKHDDGNVQGLPPMNTKDALRRVLTSLIFRIVMHGCSRLSPVANPGLTFIANFPPCLQDATIPAPDATFDTARLLQYLPKTGTLGLMMSFYNIFSFSAPYEPFIPLGGVDTQLFFPDGLTDPRNVALVAYRQAIIGLATELYGGDVPLVGQWPQNIET